LACYLPYEYTAAARGTLYIATDLAVYRHVRDETSQHLPLSQCAARNACCTSCISPPTGHANGIIRLDKLEAVGTDVNRIDWLEPLADGCGSSLNVASGPISTPAPGECVGCVCCPVHYVALAVVHPSSTGKQTTMVVPQGTPPARMRGVCIYVESAETAQVLCSSFPPSARPPSSRNRN
jgi:hypothetical protein